MAEPKVQLVAPIGNITVPGMNVTGVVTATTITADVGVAASIIQGNNIDIGTGIITATSFVGDQIGTYRAASLTGSPDLVVGVVTSSGFVAQITGDVTGDLTGNVVGTAGSILSGKDLWVGIATATLVGPGGNLAGVAGSSFTHQTVTADGATTSIDLNAGHIITLNQSASTTLSISNAKTAQLITIIRRDQTGGTQTLNWPDSISWDGGITPTLLDNTRSTAGQVFNLITRDSGDTWYGWEAASLDPQTTALFRWGGSQRGENARNSTGPGSWSSSPIQLSGAWSGISAINNGGSQNVVATKTDGTLWAWGWNDNGVLGLNNATQYSSPTQVGTDTTWGNSLARGGSGEGATLVSKTDGTLWVWGENGDGQLGLNQPYAEHRSSPCQLPGTWDIAGPKSLYSTNYASYAIKGNGTLWTWGNNAYSDLGQGNNTKYSSPMQVGTDTTWSSLGARTNGCGAIKTDGTLWTWGRGQVGQLGQNSTSNLNSPKQVGSGTDWASTFGCNGSGLAAAAIKTDGTMYVMGYNQSGKLGINQSQTDYPYISSPIQVPGTNWNSVAVNVEESVIFNKTDGTLWACGNNSYGDLGTSAPWSTQVSSPTQIPGTDWTGNLGATEKTYWAFRQSDS